MEDKGKFLFKAMLGVILEIIIISFVYAFYGQLVNDQMHYGIERSEATKMTIGQEKVIYPVSFYEDYVQSYNVSAVATGVAENWIYFELLDQEGRSLDQGGWTVADVNSNQALTIDTKELKLKKDYDYQLRLWGDGQAVVEVQEFQGRLVGAEVYNFIYEKQLKIFCIFLVILSATVLCVVLFGKGFWIRFLLVAICINILQNVASIPCSAPDDFRHFIRAYDLASGNLKCENYIKGSDNRYGMTMPVIYIPVEYAELTDLTQDSSDKWWAETNYKLFFPKWFSLFEKSESDNMVECAMLATDKISPIAYIPQIIGIWIARLMGLAPIMVYYMARFGNFLFSLALAGGAIRLVPQRKLLLSVLYFVPGMNLLRASCSTDSVLYACVLLILALFLKLWEERKKILNLKQIMLVSVLVVAIACIKLPYILVTAIFVFLPMGDNIKELFTRERIWELVKNVVTIMIICIVAYVVYTLSTKYLSYSSAELVSSNIVTYLFSNLGQVINLLLQYLFGMTFFYLQSGISGQIAGAEFVAISYLILICWIACTECRKREMPKLVRGLIACLVVGLVLVIYFVFFTISDPTSGVITGIQGRYLLPIFALGTVALPYIRAICENAVDYTFAYVFAFGMIEICCSFCYYIG